MELATEFLEKHPIKLKPLTMGEEGTLTSYLAFCKGLS